MVIEDEITRAQPQRALPQADRRNQKDSFDRINRIRHEIVAPQRRYQDL